MKYKPEVSAGKAAAIGAALGAGVGAAGNPIIPALIGGVAAGVGQAVANRKEARQGHSALNKTQFKTQAKWSDGLDDDGPVIDITATEGKSVKVPKDFWDRPHYL
jgi:hypothetical protein